MKILNKVTVTGADDSVDINEMFEIQEKYPFVEWGILLSERYSMKDGTSRFPSKEWLYKLIEKTGQEWRNNGNKPVIRLSGHICGKWTKDYLLGNYPQFNEIHSEFDWYFDRWQINTHAEYHKVDFEKAGEIIGDRLNCMPPQRVIFQLDGVNEILPHFLKRNYMNVDGLFDLSHGAGVLPSDWPKASAGDSNFVRFGYAGGLSPDNVVEQIEKISKVSGDNIIWIDAETQLRSPDNRIFDLDKVVQFLEKSKPYVI